MRPFVHPTPEEITLQGVLYALADPVRRAIFRRLAAIASRSCVACAPPNLPKSTLSHHVRVLREAGLVRSEKRGTEVANTARLDDIETRFPGLITTILRSGD
jgi:DNA-binding transcriptional ArsR family regulator